MIAAMRNQGSRTWISDLNSSNKTILDNVININYTSLLLILSLYLFYLYSAYLLASYAIFEHSLLLCNPI